MNAIAKLKQPSEWEEKIALWKRTFMKGASDDEMHLFENICMRTGLSPELKQIYPICRFDKKLGRDVWSFQTSIDGFRLMAERTGKYSPGREPTFVYDEDKKLLSATAYVKKMTADGTWHEVAATAFYNEYVQTFNGKPTQFWEKMEHNQLAKCAESLALRKAFPADLSGIYTVDEMAQAETQEKIEKPIELITEEHCYTLESLLINHDDIRNDLYEWAQIDKLEKLPLSKYEGALSAVKKRLNSIGVKQ